MRIAITGGAGFIGSHVVDLLAGKHELMIIDNFSTGKHQNISDALTKHYPIALHDADICNLPVVLGLFDAFKPTHVVHLAAQAAITTSLSNPAFDLVTNAIGTLNVITASKKAGVKKVVFSSTSAVYKNSRRKLRENSILEPDSPYGISKLTAESYLRTMFPHTTILRFGNVYGPRQVPIGENQVIPRMIKHFKFGDEFYIFGDGKHQRDFIYVEDVAEAVRAALYGTCGIYNIASGNCFSVNEIASIVADMFGVAGYKWDYAPAREQREKVQMDVSAAKSGLGWKPKVMLREGLQRTMTYWEANEY